MSEIRSTLTVSGYMRALQNTLGITIPTDVILVIIMFYPICIEFEERTINLTLNEKQIITSWFIDIFNLHDRSYTFTAKLLYRYNKDGKKGTDFHTQCDSNKNQFSIIETGFHGHIFGCFISPFTQNDGMGKYRSDDKAFLCVIRSSYDNKGPEIFKIKEDKIQYAYFDVPNWGPAFAANDLTLFKNGTNNCNHSYSYFENISGNILCGNAFKRYYSKNKLYSFEINDMNTFSIEIIDNKLKKN
eukprot:341587_1